jgi:hypothetical protein
MTKVNLIYSNTSLPFFNTLNVVTEELQRQKTDEVQINDKDENEIGRGNSYAFFDELKNKAITTTLFRQSLIDRGITDLNFQNRIFNLILQNRDGIQFGVCRVLETLIIGNNFKIFHPQGMDNDIQLHAIDEQHVELVFKSTYSDMSNVEQENPAFDIEMRFVISTDRVDITTFEFTKTSDTAETENFFNFLNEHQANFLMKFIIMIKQWLGMDVGIRLEDTQTSRPSSSK